MLLYAVANSKDQALLYTICDNYTWHILHQHTIAKYFNAKTQIMLKINDFEIKDTA